MMTQFEVGTGGTPWAAVPAAPISEAPPLYSKPEDPPPPNNPPAVSILRPTPNKVTRDRTPTIVAKIQNEVSLSKGDIELLVDGRRITDYDYDNDTGVLNHTCRRLKLGWHKVEISATDEKDLTTTETTRFRVVLR